MTTRINKVAPIITIDIHNLKDIIYQLVIDKSQAVFCDFVCSLIPLNLKVDQSKLFCQVYCIVIFSPEQ